MVIAVVDAALVALGLRVREAEEALAWAPHIYSVSILVTLHFALCMECYDALSCSQPSSHGHALSQFLCHTFTESNRKKNDNCKLSTQNSGVVDILSTYIIH